MEALERQIQLSLGLGTDESTRGSDSDDSGFYSAYELKEVLGRGLASTVRRCVEKGTGTVFAAKIVDVSAERQSEKEAERLLAETISEVNLLRQLSEHPSIITLHDFYQTPTFLFAVFEMAPKGELFDQLNRSVTVSEKKCRRYMKQLFDAVTYMHDRNIVHRDLKLENILCIDDERIVISDFGFATVLPPGTKLKELFGTPGYLAPETLRCQMFEGSEGYGLEVDDWALGVIMYTLLAGYAPFYHRRQLMMMRYIQEGKYEFRKGEWEQISDDAKDLIKRLLTVSVKDRISTKDCLTHKWMTVGVAGSRHTDETKAAPEVVKEKRNLRQLFRVAIIQVRFMHRLKNLKHLKQFIDRAELRKRPFRDREIRHEAEAAAFAVYGHWVNRGYHGRDMLFANRPRPKCRKQEAVC
uniref:phosphorylase kinase n=1 Tax=Steinernema glaseri TaxID=37863 RepID=A0A1I7ZT76_9BILA